MWYCRRWAWDVIAVAPGVTMSSNGAGTDIERSTQWLKTGLHRWMWYQALDASALFNLGVVCQDMRF